MHYLSFHFAFISTMFLIFVHICCNDLFLYAIYYLQHHYSELEIIVWTFKSLLTLIFQPNLNDLSWIEYDFEFYPSQTSYIMELLDISTLIISRYFHLIEIYFQLLPQLTSVQSIQYILWSSSKVMMIFQISLTSRWINCHTFY